MSGASADFLRYNRWANLRLIDACSELTEEQLGARGTDTSRSIQELLIHIVGSELTFVLRTMGRQHEGESRSSIHGADSQSCATLPPAVATS